MQSFFPPWLTPSAHSKQAKNKLKYPSLFKQKFAQCSNSKFLRLWLWLLLTLSCKYASCRLKNLGVVRCKPSKLGAPTRDHSTTLLVTGRNLINLRVASHVILHIVSNAQMRQSHNMINERNKMYVFQELFHRVCSPDSHS